MESFSGEVVKYAGDAFAAIWICPIAGKDIRQVVHRASMCALKMQYARKSSEKKHKTKLQFKIGIDAVRLATLAGVNDKWDLPVKGAALEQAVFAEGCVMFRAIPWYRTKRGNASRRSPVVKSMRRVTTSSRGSRSRPRERSKTGKSPEAESSIRLYVPASVTSRIDAGQGAYIELRQATIMFCNLPDIRSPASVDKDQRIIEQVQQVIFKYEGAINKLSIDDKGVSYWLSGVFHRSFTKMIQSEQFELRWVFKRFWPEEGKVLDRGDHGSSLQWRYWWGNSQRVHRHW